MAGTANRIRQHWKAMERADSYGPAATSLAGIRSAIVDASNRAAVDRIADDGWRRWAEAYVEWTAGRWAVAAAESQALIRDVKRLRRTTSHSGKARNGQPPIHHELLLGAANALLVRCLVDRFLCQANYRWSEEERIALLKQLGRWSVALENRLHGRPPSPLEMDCALAKGIWRFHRSHQGEATEEFQRMLEAADQWCVATNNQLEYRVGKLEASLWLALTMDLHGRTDEAIRCLHRVLPNPKVAESSWPRARRTLCLVRAHRARLYRYMDVAGSANATLPPDACYAPAMEDLDQAEQIARELDDRVLRSMVHDFRGDVLLARGDRDTAGREYLTAHNLARSTGEARAVGYTNYSLAKWELSGVRPPRRGLTRRRRREFTLRAQVAEEMFAQSGDQSALGMVTLLRAQAEMGANVMAAWNLLADARRRLRRWGPRRHHALAMFRTAELVIYNDQRVAEIAEEDATGFLRGAFSLVQRFSMPDRLALFREGLKNMPVDEWIDLFLHPDQPSAAANELEHRIVLRAQSAVSALAHDYGNLFDCALQNLQASSKNPRGAKAKVRKTAQAIHALVENLRTETNSLSGREALGIRVEKRPVAVTKLVHDVVALFNAVSDVRAESPLVGTIPDVKGDCLLLKRVLFNLLINARRAIARDTPQRRKIIIAASVQRNKRQRGSFVELTVTDTAGGVLPAERKNLFRVGKSGFHGGPGMGLPFCCQAMRAMGGTIFLKDPGDGKTGAVFALRLGLAR